MSMVTNINLDYNRPIKLAEDVYWVGLFDPQSGSQANPYLILDGSEAVVIDGGSRSAFPTVMMKIMQTGIAPSSVTGLIYQNYDPRFCGSIPHLESIIGRSDLKIISDKANQMFIQHYLESATFLSLEDMNHQFRFSSGRVLRFVKIPYAHVAGSFTTFDEKTGIVFTSDLFSSYPSKWELFLTIPMRCRDCKGIKHASECKHQEVSCPIHEILRYHQEMMPSERALKLALERIAELPFSTIAPQHGSIIYEPEDVILICELLSALRGVGIDGIIGDRSFMELGDINPVRERIRKQ